LRSILRKKRADVGAKRAPLLSTEDFAEEYPRYPRLSDVRLSDQERLQTVELIPYLNPMPFVVQQNAPLPRVYRLFRTMGLRHLPCVNREGAVVGMLTRKDFAFYDGRVSAVARSSAVSAQASVQVNDIE